MPKTQKVTPARTTHEREGWAPELKQKRGRPASAVADGHELAVQSFISSILQIEGQRYKAPSFVAALALTASPQSPNPLACASQVLRPDQRSDAGITGLPVLPDRRYRVTRSTTVVAFAGADVAEVPDMISESLVGPHADQCHVTPRFGRLCIGDAIGERHVTCTFLHSHRSFLC